MIWKTNWSISDDYAGSGTGDLDRLLGNYNELKAMLNDGYGFHFSFTLPDTNGRRTLLFADFLNAIEAALNALHVWNMPWIEKSVVWQPAEVGPNNEDINRWEKNGAEVEGAAARVRDTWYFMNELYMGEV